MTESFRYFSAEDDARRRREREECCQEHRPRFGYFYTCPECGARWELSGDGPGPYWEKSEDVAEQKRRAEERKP